jgi:hypothetical protein
VLVSINKWHNSILILNQSYTYILHLDKGSTRFAPKVKPRINRAPTDATKQSNEATKPISSQNNTESGKEKEKEKFSSGRIAKLPVKVTKPQSMYSFRRRDMIPSAEIHDFNSFIQ